MEDFFFFAPEQLRNALGSDLHNGTRNQLGPDPSALGPDPDSRTREQEDRHKIQRKGTGVRWREENWKKDGAVGAGVG